VTGTANPSGAPEFIPDFSGVRVTQSLVFCVVFCSSLSFLFWFLITPLVSSNFSYDNNLTILPVENAEITCNDYVLAAYDKICYMGKVLENNLSDRTYILEHVEDYVRDCITSTKF
jgi:hypothetical protein